ncbi:MAG: cupin domain-containing protein, partial [Candidatus Levyibacteriota bacterium]
MPRYAFTLLTLVCGIVGLAAGPSPAIAQQALVIKPLVQKKVADLPPGPLFWRVENFPDRAQAVAAESTWSLVAESAGRIWLFTLGAPDGNTPGGTKVAELGPIPRFVAPQYLLRINEASGPPGSTTAVHSHPGSEAFLVISGEQSIRGPNGVMRVAAGQAAAGQEGGIPMQVTSSGKTDLHALVMFVV